MATLAIADLSPSLADADEKRIRAVVTLLWPFSSSTRKVALLLADLDFRQRKKSGQVRVQLSGPAAQAVARSKIGIGDEVVLELTGARWVDAAPGVVTPGKSIDSELLFRDKLHMLVRREGKEVAVLDVNDPNAPPPPEILRPPTNGGAVTPRPSRVDDYETPISSYTPSFYKRARISGGSYVDSAFDPFAPDQVDPQGREKKRPRISWGVGAHWKLSERQVSPPMELETENWLDVEVESPTKTAGANHGQTGPSLSADSFRIPHQSMDSTLPSTQASADFEAAHIELPDRQNPREKYASEYSQRLAQELGGDTEDEQEVENEPPNAKFAEHRIQSSADNASSQGTAQPTSKAQTRSKSQTKPSDRHISMPPPALPALQTSQFAPKQTENLRGPLSGVSRSPPTPELHPLQSAILPLPSPFPGEQLEQTSFYQPQPRDFRSPSISNQIGIVPDSMFQFGFGLNSTTVSASVTERASASAVSLKQLDKALDTQQSGDDPKGSSAAPASVSEGPEVLDGDALTFESAHVTTQHEYRDLQRISEEPEQEEEEEEGDSSLPDVGQSSLPPQPISKEPIVIDLLDSSSSSESEEDSEEEVEAEIDQEVEEDAHSEISGSEESDEEDSEDEGASETYEYEEQEEYEGSYVDDNDEVERSAPGFTHIGHQHEESARQTSEESESSDELYREDFAPPTAPRAAATHIDLTSDSDEEGVEKGTTDDHAVSASEHADVESGQRQLSHSLSSQGQDIYQSPVDPMLSQQSVGSYGSQSVTNASFDRIGVTTASSITNSASLPVQQVTEPADDEMNDIASKVSASGIVHYPELPPFDGPQSPIDEEMHSAAAQLEMLRSSPLTQIHSVPNQESNIYTRDWAPDSIPSFGSQFDSQNRPLSLPEDNNIPDAQMSFGTNEWLGSRSPPAIKSTSGDVDTSIFADVNLSPLVSPQIGSFPRTQEPEQLEQSEGIPTTTTSVISDSLQVSQPTTAAHEASQERRGSPAPEMEQVSNSAVLSTIASTLSAPPQTQDSPSTLGAPGTAPSMQHSAPPPIDPSLTQESHTLRAATQLSTSNGTHGSPNGAASQPASQPALSEPPASAAGKGLRTPLSYYAPLSSLRPYINSPAPPDGVDVLAAVSGGTSAPRRAKAGARQWFCALRVVDASGGDAAAAIRVLCFREWRAALPVAERGDVVLLRAFEVVGAKGAAGFALRSGEGSAWCVWWGGGVGTEEVRGPPVEVGDEEREEVRRLKGWFDATAHEAQSGRDKAIEDHDETSLEKAKI